MRSKIVGGFRVRQKIAISGFRRPKRHNGKFCTLGNLDPVPQNTSAGRTLYSSTPSDKHFGTISRPSWKKAKKAKSTRKIEVSENYGEEKTMGSWRQKAKRRIWPPTLENLVPENRKICRGLFEKDSHS